MPLLILCLFLFTTPKTNFTDDCDSCKYKGNVLFVKKTESVSFEKTSVEIGSNTINLRIISCCRKSDSLIIEGQVIFPEAANLKDSSSIKMYYCSLKGSVYKIEKEIPNNYRNGILDIRLKKCSKRFLVVYSDKYNGVVVRLKDF